MNPCSVLDVAWDADKATIVKAQARALKARRHSAQVIAEACRALMDDETRLLAGFCQPPWGQPEPIEIPPEVDELPGPLPAYPMEDFEALRTELVHRMACDEQEARNLPGLADLGPLPVPAQLVFSLEAIRA